MSYMIAWTHYTNPNASSVPTQDQVLVPETLLKKRKSQEAARAERRAEIEAKKKVGSSLQMQFPCNFPFLHLSSNNLMKTPTTRLDQRSMLSPVNHLSGLILVDATCHCLHTSIIEDLLADSNCSLGQQGEAWRHLQAR